MSLRPPGQREALASSAGVRAASPDKKRATLVEAPLDSRGIAARLQADDYAASS
jgi:hypothetical protein